MGGQSIFVIPEYNVIVAFTGWVSGSYDLIYRNIIEDYILQFSTGTGGAIPGSPLPILMSIIVFTVAIHGFTIKKKNNISTRNHKNM